MTVSDASEIMALAVVEAFDSKDEECLQLLREFYAVLRRKHYSRDLLYRDLKDPRRFVNIRHWRSEEARKEAHEDPDVHGFWKRLSEIAKVTHVFERLEDLSPRDSMAKRQ
jgi:quinol monooxygenase YgiN